MARAISMNAEIVIAGNPEPVYPLEISEIGEGEEGRLDVADGGRKYKVRDQIFDIGEVAVTILFTRDRREYDVMQEWCLSGAVRDCYVNYRDSAGNIRLQYALYNCECAMGKFHGFNRNSKEVDTKKYVLLPTEIEDITAAAVAPDPYVRPAQ